MSGTSLIVKSEFVIGPLPPSELRSSEPDRTRDIRPIGCAGTLPQHVSLAPLARLCAVLGREFPLEHRQLDAEPGAAGDLSRFAGTYGWPDRRVEVRAKDASLLIKSNDGEVVRNWASMGLGCALRSEWDAAPSISRGELKRVLSGWEFEPANVMALVSARRAGVFEEVRTVTPAPPEKSGWKRLTRPSAVLSV